MEAHGPLWVASLTPGVGPHIRVVGGIEGDRLSIVDPWPPGQGSRYIRAFDRFFGQMEDLGARERGEPAPIYVAYLDETV